MKGSAEPMNDKFCTLSTRVPLWRSKVCAAMYTHMHQHHVNVRKLHVHLAWLSASVSVVCIYIQILHIKLQRHAQT